eukprot:Rhum_TRINITY_DN10927_c0_g3::Rhum_TRINITY_DN10927_c0_g3_i1::g.41313::m.41313
MLATPYTVPPLQAPSLATPAPLLAGLPPPPPPQAYHPQSLPQALSRCILADVQDPQLPVPSRPMTPRLVELPHVSPQRRTDLGPEGQVDDVGGVYVRVKRKLCWFYKRFNPGKIDMVDRILRERGGPHAAHEVFEELRARYNGGSEYLAAYEALEEFYGTYNPEKADLVGPVMEEWRDREDKLMKTLEKKYGCSFFRDRALILPRPDVRAPIESLVERYIRGVYTQYCPQMLPFVPTLLIIYKERYVELASAVALKFNVPVPQDLLRLLDGAPPLPSPAVTTVTHTHTHDAAPQGVQTVLEEKDTLIKAQMSLIEDYAMQLDQRKQEADAHEQTVAYLRQLHTRANSVIEKFGRHISTVSEKYSQDNNGAQMPLGELASLCDILGISKPDGIDLQHQHQQPQQQQQQLRTTPQYQPQRTPAAPLQPAPPLYPEAARQSWTTHPAAAPQDAA